MDEIQRTADHAGSASAAVSSPKGRRGPSAVAPVSASVETRPRKDRFLRNCKVCVSANIAEVEQMASVGVEATIIGRRFGIPHNSVRRHVRNHISADRWARLQGKSYFGRDDVDTASKLKELRDRERDGLLLRLSIQRSDLNALTKNEDSRVAVAAHNALIRLHELVGRVLGEIQTGTNVSIDNRSVNIGTNDILELRAVVEKALAAFPAARTALLHALATAPTALVEAL